MTFSALRCLALCLLLVVPCDAQEPSYKDFPEQSEIDDIRTAEKPEGVLFLVMEQDEEAFNWVLPRVIHYTQQLRDKWKDLTIVVLSHGEEMFALRAEYRPLYEKMHQDVLTLVSKHQVLFQVCGSYANFSNVAPSEFPDYIDVVPFAPAEIENYRLMEFKIINLELTW